MIQLPHAYISNHLNLSPALMMFAYGCSADSGRSTALFSFTDFKATPKRLGRTVLLQGEILVPFQSCSPPSPNLRRRQGTRKLLVFGQIFSPTISRIQELLPMATTPGSAISSADLLTRQISPGMAGAFCMPLRPSEEIIPNVPSYSLCTRWVA
jgi:hypothetical protein